jgi:ketosteroid isomerase-like protein
VSETYVEVVRRCLAAVEADDVEAALQLLDANVVVTPSSELVTGSTGPYHGHAGARRWFAEAALAVQKLRFEPYEFVDFGDQVYVSGRHSWSATAPTSANTAPRSGALSTASSFRSRATRAATTR